MNVPTYDILDCGTLTGTNTVVPLLGEPRLCVELIVQSDPSNTANVGIGNDLVQWWVLAPGATLTVPARHINIVYVRFPANSTQRVNWIAMR